jgi:formylglycine-generating enzyme required for sulfatase activity
VGQQNGWGLKNYVGNAQELVRTTNGLILRGGAYTDSHAQCSYELERSYEASAPETTGFRVVREDIPKTE